MKDAILTFLKEQAKPVSITVLLNRFKEHTEYEIKEAVWQLLNEHKAELTPTRLLVAA